MKNQLKRALDQARSFALFLGMSSATALVFGGLCLESFAHLRKEKDSVTLDQEAFLQKVEHLDLAGSGHAWHEFMQEQQEVVAAALFSSPGFQSLDQLIALGALNLKWIDQVNAARSEGNRLPLSTPETTGGIPIDQPRITNEKIILKSAEDLSAQMPEWMKKVYLGEEPLTERVQGPDAEFLSVVRKVDRLYQNASRYKMLAPARLIYARRAKEDVRGYYAFLKNPSWVTEISKGEIQDAELKSKIRTALLGVCFNSSSMRSCTRDLEKTPWKNVYDKYIQAAREVYENYFILQNPRREVSWTAADPTRLNAPFQKPTSEKIAQWLKANVEDEYRWDFQGKSWGLKIDFSASGFSLPRVVFEAGVTPHVNGLGGDTITMDENANIDNYQERWIIRHEYGHVLGLPDCYVEFYDTNIDAFVSYQLDLDNLMCSRRGKFQQIHFDELKRAYFR